MTLRLHRHENSLLQASIQGNGSRDSLMCHAHEPELSFVGRAVAWASDRGESPDVSIQIDADIRTGTVSH